MGFITSETTDQLIMRDMASQEHQLAKADITERTKMPNSMMPAGLMHNFSVKEFASPRLHCGSFFGEVMFFSR